MIYVPQGHIKPILHLHHYERITCPIYFLGYVNLLFLNSECNYESLMKTLKTGNTWSLTVCLHFKVTIVHSKYYLPWQSIIDQSKFEIEAFHLS